MSAPRNAGQARTLRVLAELAGPKGWCSPTEGFLCLLTDFCAATMYRHLAALEADGLIERRSSPTGLRLIYVERQA